MHKQPAGAPGAVSSQLNRAFHPLVSQGADPRRYIVLACKCRKPMHEEPPAKSLTGREMGIIVSSLNAIDAWNGFVREGWEKATTDYSSLPDSGKNVVVGIGKLRFSICSAMHEMKPVLEGACRRSGRRYEVSVSPGAIAVLGPAFSAEIALLPSKKLPGFEAGYRSVQNGWSFKINPVYATEASLYLLFERLVFSVLNHKPACGHQ